MTFYAWLGFFFITGLTIPFQPALAQEQAQEPLEIRAGLHEDYARLVFSWDEYVDYTLRQPAPTRVVLAFGRSAAWNPNTLDLERIPPVTRLDQVSEPGNALRMVLSLKNARDLRHFRIGNRIVLDIFYESAPETAPSPKEEEKQEERNEDEKSEAPPKPKTTPQAQSGGKAGSDPGKTSDTPDPQPDTPEQPTPGGEPRPEAESRDPGRKPEPKQSELEPLPEEDDDEEQASPPVNAEIVLSAGSPFGLAVFQTPGKLFLISDRQARLIPPQVRRGERKALGTPEQIPVEGGTAFAFDLPGPTPIAVTGGGMIWRIKLGDFAETVQRKPLTPRRDYGQPSVGPMIILAFENTGKVMNWSHPVTGVEYDVVPAKMASRHVDQKWEFVDFDILPAPSGTVIRPYTRELQVIPAPGRVLLQRPGGLRLSAREDISRKEVEQEQSRSKQEKELETIKFFRFKEWRLGSLKDYERNRRRMEQDLADQMAQPERAAETALKLARFQTSHGFGAEALGYMRLALQFVPGLSDNAEIQALEGVANAVAGRGEEALRLLSTPDYDTIAEIQLWQAYAAALDERWRTAYEAIPEDLPWLSIYPEPIRTEIILSLAEAALRFADTPLAEGLLRMVESAGGLALSENKGKDDQETKRKDSRQYRNIPPENAAMQYFLGEAHRQLGEFDRAEKLWKPVARSGNRQYRAKAGLALVNLQLQRDDITPREAIDRLERLRYTWRGDDLETQIIRRLGQIYLQTGNYRKALSILREAASFAGENEEADAITTDMTEAFTALFIGPRADDISPLNAVTIFEEFQELVPAGKRGEAVVQALAEKLVDVDLLGRAGDVLQNQVENRLQGNDAARVGTRLAAIRLLDNKPEKALQSLDISLKDGVRLTEDLLNRRRLLRARALSELERTDAAFAELEKLPANHQQARKLRVDIAWRAGRWDIAAQALGPLIESRVSENPDKAPDPETAKLILNQVVAANLAENRELMTQLRDQHLERMDKTPQARLFRVVTRPAQRPTLTDRKTLMSIVSEVDVFRDFLDALKSGD